MKPKTITASFRLDQSAFEALQDDARNRNISVNTLLNQLILTYANFDQPMKRFRLIKLSASTFRYILRASKGKTIMKAGYLAGKDGPRTFILAKWGEYTCQKSLVYLKMIGSYSGLFDYSEVMLGEKIIVTLTHDFGSKGSLFLKEYVRGVLEPICKDLRFQEDDNAVVFEIV